MCIFYLLNISNGHGSNDLRCVFFIFWTLVMDMEAGSCRRSEVDQKKMDRLVRQEASDHVGAVKSTRKQWTVWWGKRHRFEFYFFCFLACVYPEKKGICQGAIRHPSFVWFSTCLEEWRLIHLNPLLYGLVSLSSCKFGSVFF